MEEGLGNLQDTGLSNDKTSERKGRPGMGYGEHGVMSCPCVGRGGLGRKNGRVPHPWEESFTSSDKCSREGDRAEDCEGATGLES